MNTSRYASPTASHSGEAEQRNLQSGPSRRRFLGISAAAWATVSIVPARVLGAAGQASAKWPQARRCRDFRENEFPARGGEKAGCHFEWAGMLAEAVQLGNIAIRTGERLAWDAAPASFKNHPQATALVKANYQNGWILEGA